MWNFSCPIACYARIFTTILNHDMTYIHVAYDITMNCYILTNEKSTNTIREEKKINEKITIYSTLSEWLSENDERIWYFRLYATELMCIKTIGYKLIIRMFSISFSMSMSSEREIRWEKLNRKALEHFCVHGELMMLKPLQTLQSFVITRVLLWFYHPATRMITSNSNHIVFNIQTKNPNIDIKPYIESWKVCMQISIQIHLGILMILPFGMACSAHLILTPPQTKCSYSFWHHIKQLAVNKFYVINISLRVKDDTLQTAEGWTAQNWWTENDKGMQDSIK